MLYKEWQGQKIESPFGPADIESLTRRYDRRQNLTSVVMKAEYHHIEMTLCVWVRGLDMVGRISLVHVRAISTGA